MKGLVAARNLKAMLLAAIVILSSGGLARADIVLSGFGPQGQGGTVNGETFSFGSGGSIYEMDAFINIAGFDLNTGQIGTAAQLSIDGLPAGLEFAHGYELNTDRSDVTVTYQFTNRTGSTLQDFRFFGFVDAEIDVPINDYFNEFASINGSLGFGAGDSIPDSFEVDEPGYVFGDIFSNLRLGTLDNTNAINSTFPDDVSIALGFTLGNIAPGDQILIELMLSEDGDQLGGFSVVHRDSDVASNDEIWFSGSASISSVPEPSSLVLFFCSAILCSTIRRRNSIC